VTEEEKDMEKFVMIYMEYLHTNISKVVGIFLRTPMHVYLRDIVKNILILKE
jgi:hypothetical protein